MSDTDAINATIDRAKHTVLVVDDNAATRYSTGRVLAASGFTIAEAASGNEALELSKRGVSAMVLDVNLPDIDGFVVCRAVRATAETANLPIIHLSASHVANEDRITGLNAGADAYIVHPAEPAVLVATIQALIRARTAEDQLRGREQSLRAIYTHAQSGIALLDRNGLFIDANPAMQRLMGRALDQIAGRRFQVFSGYEVAGQGVWHGEITVEQPDGKKVVLDCTVSEPFGEGSRIATAVDISERHQLEQQRRELLEREQAARAAAEQHSRTKDDFIAVLSHELRTPLSAIVGWVAVMQRRDPTPEQMKALVSIERNVKAQARIISDILDVSRINSGKLRVERERVDPAEVIRNALTALQKDIGDRKVRVDLDAVDFADAAWLDPNRFEQIFWNLMTNAIKFSPPGGTVLVRLRREGDNLKLSVRDWGQGIDPEFLPRLFDRFSQSDAPGNRRQGGLGLGMAIVKHLVDLHGGRVQASSEGAGHGSLIEVEMPVFGASFADEAPAETETSGNTQGHSEFDSNARPLENLSVLVVEDDAGAAEMLSVVLADRGASVRIAKDYDTALEALRLYWPDAMVSDIGLPGRDGYELIRAVRGLPPPPGSTRLPAVALTAFARAEDRVRALQAGFDSHVTKPLKPHALVAALRSVVPVRK